MTPSVSFLPREHGAYAEVALPLLTAILLGSPTTASAALTATVVLCFLAHEPFLVMRGARGERARAQAGRAARTRTAALALAAAATAGIFAWHASFDALVLASVPALFAALAVALILIDGERTTVGELIVSTTLSSVAVPVAVGSGLPAPTGATIAVVWAITFGLATLTVRAVILRSKAQGDERPWEARAALPAAALALASVALAPRMDLPTAYAAVAPGAVVAFVIAWAMPHPRHLRRIGWALVATDVAVLATLLATLR